tara:strand:+ start:6269 stop:7894 length:1626 start_codon:yes stop_codon:yes gene_type:complete
VKKKLKTVISDTLFVAKITKTNNKKIIILVSVLFSQIIAVLDILIILFFASVFTENYQIGGNLNFLNFIFEFKILFPIVITARYVLFFIQSMLLKNLELNVQNNLKAHFLSEVFNKRNFSSSDVYFYMNILSTHISFFFKSIAYFLNYFLQSLAFIIYLIFYDYRSIQFLIIFILLLSPLLKFLIKTARNFTDKQYGLGIETNSELERVIDNVFLIKLLKKEKTEVSRFTEILSELKVATYKQHQVTVINSALPSFVTVLALSIISSFFGGFINITIDFVGIVLRLFQLLSSLSTATNQVINSQVHIKKFYDLEFYKPKSRDENFIINKKIPGNVAVEFKNVDFSYLNSDDLIFENLNLQFKKSSHTIISGPNGSGKSTILGLLSGVFLPLNGTVETFSDKFAYIGPSPLIFRDSLRENLTYGKNSPTNDEEIFSLLKNFNIFSDVENIDLEMEISNKSLSSGQMQKIAFIRAFLSKPEILILDEATSNLDQNSKEFIFKLLKDSNLTIINSTHEYRNFKNYDSHLLIQTDGDRRIINIVD